MKETKKTSKKLVRCAIYLAVLVAVAGISLLAGVFDDVSDLTSMITIRFSTVVKLVVMVCFVLVVAGLLEFVLSALSTGKKRIGTMMSILSSLTKYVAAIVILCWGLSILGVNVSTIVASVGIITLVVGFSAESMIADVVTGAFMLFENQYNIGDIVEVNDFRGTVTKIGIRTTCITDTGDNVKIINNSDMRNILNRSDKLSRSVTTIGIPYATDLEKLEAQIPALMQKIYEKRMDIFKSAPRYLGVESLADSAVVLKFVVDVDENNIYSGVRLLNRDLLLGFRSLGVECPFPQVDVHHD